MHAGDRRKPSGYTLPGKNLSWTQSDQTNPHVRLGLADVKPRAVFSSETTQKSGELIQDGPLILIHCLWVH